MNTLYIETISKSYSKKIILDSLNIRFDYGITGILGENGAGKTTLLKIISGLITPESGKIYFDEKSKP